MVEQVIDSHPEILIVAVCLTALLLAIAIAWALDVFLAAAERDDVAVPSVSPAPEGVDAGDLMAAHAAVVRRHARERVQAR